jgi:hypothetical protein
VHGGRHELVVVDQPVPAHIRDGHQLLQLRLQHTPHTTCGRGQRKAAVQRQGQRACCNRQSYQGQEAGCAQRACSRHYCCLLQLMGHAAFTACAPSGPGRSLLVLRQSSPLCQLRRTCLPRPTSTAAPSSHHPPR